jgi:hypothetical protein
MVGIKTGGIEIEVQDYDHEEHHPQNGNCSYFIFLIIVSAAPSN